MSEPFRLVGTLQGGAEIERRFLDAKDRIRKKIRRALVDLGDEMLQVAQSKAPHNKGRHRSRMSVLYGPLWKSIRPRVRVPQAGVMKLSIRPIVFYGLMVEGGYHKYAAGEKRWDGKHNRTVKVKAYSQGVRYVADERYDVYDVKGGRKQRRVLVARGVRPSMLKSRSIKDRIGTAGRHSFVKGQPFMAPMWAEMRGKVNERLQAALADAVKGEGGDS